MIVVLAPDSFKGTIGAAGPPPPSQKGGACVRPDDDIVLLPMADGGEGTLDAFAAAVPGAERIAVRVVGPDAVETDSAWLRLPPTPATPGGSAIVELGATSGIELLDELRPLDAHTYGLGQAISAALEAGVSRVVVGLGSSASTDGGTGMLRALGARFLDADDAEVPLGGAGLAAVARVDLSGLAALPPGGVTALTDVTNPLLGRRGAATVFGPQKGADQAQVAELDAGLAHLAGSSSPIRRPPAREPPAAPASDCSRGARRSSRARAPWPSHRAAGGCGRGIRRRHRRRLVRRAVGRGQGALARRLARGRGDASGPGRRADHAGCRHLGVRGVGSLTALAGSPEQAMAEPARWLREAGERFARELG